MFAPRSARAVDWTRAACYAGCALVALAFAALVGLLVFESLPVWRHAGVGFLSRPRWFYRQAEFGASAMIYGTVAVSAVALLLAAPVGVSAAVFISEILPRRLRFLVKAAVELLAGVPSVVYGLLGLLLLRDWIYRLLEPWEPLSGDTLLTAGALLAVMILPTVITLSDDALGGVPAAQRQAARALGLNRAEVVLGVSLRQALPGVAAAVLLALGRAVGETIAIFLVVGRQDNQWPERLLSLRPLGEAGQTMTSKLAGSETFLAMGDPLHWAAMLGLAALVLVFSGLLTWVGVSLAGLGESPGQRSSNA